ncbi:hypothetical protein K9U40_20290 [Xanthobacter autotrophicus]|uniref:hypothetical protein n=1 Tax=Xanthobacter TaxID=279 RepID=UPI0024AADEF5|nr:hypothetical protein [Xanthobacter autotrophicus]MDI4666641.1 hypothetical protein [Xanthobacter autotrophicus]
MRTPHRRDISARQDLLGRELRQLFDDYTQEDMPGDLQKLAEQLQAAFEGRGDEPSDPEPSDPKSSNPKSSNPVSAGQAPSEPARNGKGDAESAIAKSPPDGAEY